MTPEQLAYVVVLAARDVADDGGRDHRLRRAVVAPYGSWRSPFPIELLAGGSWRSSARSRRRWACLVARGTARRRTAARRSCACAPGGEPEEHRPARDQRPQPRPRVRRRGHTSSTATWSSSRTSSRGRLHRLGPGRACEPITPERAWRYADVDPRRRPGPPRRRPRRPRPDGRRRVRERDRRDPASTAATVEVLADGSRLLSPRRGCRPTATGSPGSNGITRTCPGTARACALADARGDGSLGRAGRPSPATRRPGCAQPRWSADGRPVVRRRARRVDQSPPPRRDGRAEPVAARWTAEFAWPDWVFGARNLSASWPTVGPSPSPGPAAATGCYLLEPATGSASVAEIALPFTEIGRRSRSTATASSASSGRPDRGAGRSSRSISAAVTPGRAAGSTRSRSTPPTVSRPASRSPSRRPDGRIAHAIFYPPHNPAFRGPEWRAAAAHRHAATAGRRPTPTRAFSAAAQAFTSRGIAVVDVDYGGSTGYGQAYRKALEGEWGIVDVDDCVAPAQVWLAGQGAGRRRAAGRPRRQRIGLHDARAPSPSATSSRPGPRTSGSATSRRSSATPTSSNRATSSVWSVRCPRRRALSRALADSIADRISVPGAHPPGRRGPDRAADRGRADRRPRCGRTASRTPSCSSPARTTASARRPPSDGRSRPSCRSTARSSASCRPTTSSRWSSKPGPHLARAVGRPAVGGATRCRVRYPPCRGIPRTSSAPE